MSKENRKSECENIAKKEKVEADQKFFGVRIPIEQANAMFQAVKKGVALNEADYIRDAIRKKLREDGLL